MWRPLKQRCNFHCSHKAKNTFHQAGDTRSACCLTFTCTCLSLRLAHLLEHSDHCDEGRRKLWADLVHSAESRSRQQQGRRVTTVAAQLLLPPELCAERARAAAASASDRGSRWQPHGGGGDEWGRGRGGAGGLWPEHHLDPVQRHEGFDEVLTARWVGRRQAWHPSSQR